MKTLEEVIKDLKELEQQHRREAARLAEAIKTLRDNKSGNTRAVDYLAQGRIPPNAHIKPEKLAELRELVMTLGDKGERFSVKEINVFLDWDSREIRRGFMNLRAEGTIIPYYPSGNKSDGIRTQYYKLHQPEIVLD